jgi:transcriptional accessory protein Tex/SPT6
LEEDMDEADLREILSQLQKIEDLNKNEIKPLIEDLQMMLEEFKLTGSAIVTI